MLVLLPRSHGFLPWCPEPQHPHRVPAGAEDAVFALAVQLRGLMDAWAAEPDCFTCGPAARAVAARMGALPAGEERGAHRYLPHKQSSRFLCGSFAWILRSAPSSSCSPTYAALSLYDIRSTHSLTHTHVFALRSHVQGSPLCWLIAPSMWRRHCGTTPSYPPSSLPAACACRHPATLR